MLVNPLTRDLFAGDGRFLKRLACPAAARLTPGSLHCDRCARSLVDVHARSEADLAALLDEHPDTCLAIDLSHPGVYLTHRRRP